jgi:hypothetical protein
MSLYAGNRAVMTWPEFRELAEELLPEWNHPALTNLGLGLPVDERELRLALDVSVRLAAASEIANEIIDRVLARLNRSGD